MTDVKHSAFGSVLWLGRVDYERALIWQRKLAKMRKEGLSRDTIMMLEHPPVFTVGKSGKEENYLKLKDKAVFVERGGDVTYHGPGQLVVYYIFDLSRRDKNLHKFMSDIQQGIIDTLFEYGITAKRGNEHTGIWVEDRKIASIGIAVKHWVTFHGSAINLNTNLEDFQKINPCGLSSTVITSLKKETGKQINMNEFCTKLVAAYENIFEMKFETIYKEELAEQLESQSGKNLI
ncbi:MAG TPA: lipoyl(octanoyl) transferase LipB [candidate division Zixibacteria bacterium]|nr:lipoyl(octanoyl) transferase LipB [candidate division Zixibacteria bacterium]